MKGFTLLELMIVVVIISIFAAIAIPSYQSYSRKNNEKIAVQKVHQVALKLENEKTRNFSYSGFTLDFEDGTTGNNRYSILVDTTDLEWTVYACVDSSLSDKARYQHFALNNTGAECNVAGSAACPWVCS